MDKITTYQAIVKELLLKYSTYGKRKDDPIESQVIFDEERHHYLLMGVGWRVDRLVYGISFHIDIKPDGKVWVQQDNTDLVIVDKLLEKGIPKSDMVLGFHPPYVRPQTDFAVS